MSLHSRLALLVLSTTATILGFGGIVLVTHDSVVSFNAFLLMVNSSFATYHLIKFLDSK